MTTERCDCKQLEEELDAFPRGELSDDQTEILRRHLAECRHCACIERHEQAFLERLRTIDRCIDLQPELSGNRRQDFPGAGIIVDDQDPQPRRR